MTTTDTTPTPYSPTAVQLVVLDSPAARRYAEALAGAGLPVGVLGARHTDVIGFLAAPARHHRVVALVADADDPEQFADAVARIQSRLGRVTAVIRHRRSAPPTPVEPPSPVELPSPVERSRDQPAEGSRLRSIRESANRESVKRQFATATNGRATRPGRGRRAG